MGPFVRTDFVVFVLDGSRDGELFGFCFAGSAGGNSALVISGCKTTAERVKDRLISKYTSFYGNIGMWKFVYINRI